MSAGGFKPCHGSLSDQFALELGKGCKDAKISLPLAEVVSISAPCPIRFTTCNVGALPFGCRYEEEEAQALLRGLCLFLSLTIPCFKYLFDALDPNLDE